MAVSWRQWLLGASIGDADPTEASGEDWPFRPAAVDLIGRLGDVWVDANFRATPEDQEAAWVCYSQLRSRIVTQPLPYLDGDEKSALTSLYNLFDFARNLCKEVGPKCNRFSDLVWTMLNDHVRPVTAKWHKRFVDDRLKEDDRHDFREQLEKLQETIRYFEQVFLALARDERITVPPKPAASRPTDLTDPATPLPFDRIVYSPSVDRTTAEAIFDAEQTAIRQRRGIDGRQPLTDVAGLALSGGGLRSATFALGALQGLAQRGVLGNFDFLSTVSGGGYAGSFLSCYLNSPRRAGDAPIGLDSDQLPFQRDQAQESAPLRHLRSSSKSLLAGDFWRKIEIPVLAMLGWLASVAVALPPIALLTLLGCYTNRAAIERALQGNPIIYPAWTIQHDVVAIFAAALALGLVGIGFIQHHRRRRGNRADLPFALIAIVGCIGLATLVLIGWILFPYTVRALGAVTDGSDIRLPSFNETVTAAIAAGAIPLFSRLAVWVKETNPLKPLFTAIAVGVLPIVFLWLVATLLAKYGLFVEADSGFSEKYAIYWLLGSVGTLAFFWLFLNVNAVSLHPFYRDRIARAYHVKQSDDELLSSAKQKLSKLREHNQQGPYHLINAALNAPAGINPALRGRTADFFLFSSEYCGSESTGYQKTTEFEKADRSLDLATAIAISGAAASPFMGVGNSQFSFWATLLNIRLDYWLPIQGRVGLRSPGTGYWLRQYLGNVRDTTPYVNLSDGGHIENMGLYELLRRRCRYIVVVDGECDPGITSGSFLQVLRYAKIDFGIDIKIDLSRLKFARPDDGSPGAASSAKASAQQTASPTVDFHFALGRVQYGEDRVGLLLYLKSSVSGNEGKPIENYRNRNPDFPHESTADLAYDEEQFEAYRSLGEHIVDDTFRAELVGETKPTKVADWLHALERKLHR